jgi:hypothetical protein
VNTAVFARGNIFELNVEAPFTVLPVQHQPKDQPKGGGAPAPITQEGEQESESGEIDQTFEVS